MSGECEQCGEDPYTCECGNLSLMGKIDNVEKAYTVYRGINGEVFLAFGNYAEYIKWLREQK